MQQKHRRQQLIFSLPPTFLQTNRTGMEGAILESGKRVCEQGLQILRPVGGFPHWGKGRTAGRDQIPVLHITQLLHDNKGFRFTALVEGQGWIKGSSFSHSPPPRVRPSRRRRLLPVLVSESGCRLLVPHFFTLLQDGVCSGLDT